MVSFGFITQAPRSRICLFTDNKSAVTFHQNEPYISGSFGSDDKLKTGILKWNGTSWQTVAGGIESDYSIHNEISVSDMISYHNNLFVWAI
jgi:hypothetical protein